MAATKGITIDFRGNDTPLRSAINKIRNEAKSLDKELGYIDSLLRKNGNNAKIWEQKQTVLNKQIKDTRSRLDEMRKLQEQLIAKGVDKTSDQYRELEREIVKAETKMKSFRKELDRIGSTKVKALSEGFKQVGKHMAEAGKTLTTKLTAPIVAMGTASVVAFNDVQNALNIVTKKTGATGKELQEMQDIARDLAKTMPTDFASAGTAVGELNTRFGVTGNQLEELSAQYIKFAKVNSTDLNSSIDQTQKALYAFGLTAEDAPHLLDTLTRASQLTGASVDTLTSGLIQNGTAFQEMGLSMDQSVMLMAQMEKSGANSETVMQGLRKALKSAAKDGVPLNQALKDLQNTILNGTDSMDGLSAAYDLFGKSGDQIYGAIKNGTLDFEALGDAVDDTGGTLDRVFNDILTPTEEFQIALNSLKDVGYQLGTSIMQVLQPIIEALTVRLQELSDWWGNLSPKAQDTIVKVGMVVAAIGPLLMIIGTLISTIGTIMGAINSFGVVMTALSGPVGIAIGIIAALVAAGVWLYQNWDMVKEKAGQLKDWVVEKWTALKERTVAVFEAIRYAITHPFETAFNFIKNVVDKIKGLFNNFNITLPHIKLPHFSIDPPGWGLGDLLKGVIPKLGIDWYKNGGIFTNPTVFTGIGVGDVPGGEAVLPLRKLWEEMDRRFAGDGITINVNASPGMDVNELANAVQKRIIELEQRRKYAWL